MRIIGAREDDLLRDDSEDLLQRLYKAVPRQTQDVLAMFVFLGLIPIAFLFEIFFVVGDFYTPWTGPWLLRAGVLTWMFANCYINYALMVRTGPNGSNAILPNTFNSNFRYCHSCRAQAPPRAFHCPVCDKCAFRRDHHCSFGAVCVGHFNQRYFCAAVANLWPVCLTAVLYNGPWLAARLGNFNVIQVWQILLPHVALIFRVISFTQFLCILVMSFSLVVFFFVTYLVAAQVYCLWRGQTRVEYLLDVHAYQLGFAANLKHSLGANWPLALLFPFMPSPLPSPTGMHFETREMQKHHDTKSM